MGDSSHTPEREIFRLTLTSRDQGSGRKVYELSGSISSDDIVGALEDWLWERIEPRLKQRESTRNLTVAEAAKRLNASQGTVRRLVQDQSIPSFRVRGRILIRQTDLDDWVLRQVKGDMRDGRAGHPPGSRH